MISRNSIELPHRMTLPNDHSEMILEDVSDLGRNGPILSESESRSIINSNTVGYLAHQTGESYRSGPGQPGFKNSTINYNISK